MDSVQHHFRAAANLSFKGFGEASHDCQWPDNARIAISFVLNYEEGGERNVMDGDPYNEPYLWEKGSTMGVKAGGRYMNAEQDFEYGSRVGCWRVLRLMKEFGFQMTLWAIAKAMERNPSFAKACVKEGHEIGAHGLRWLEIWEYSLEDDKKYIRDTCQALKAATGEMPVGFYFGRGTSLINQIFTLHPLTLWQEHHKLTLWSRSCTRRWARS